MQCLYCKPRGFTTSQTTSALSIHEITNLVRAFANCGVTKVRLTGGEPLTRADVIEIVGAVANTPRIDTFGLTTNGTGLAELAPDLARAGLQRINISLDSLNRDTFRRITGRDMLNNILNGIDVALSCGFRRIKLNTVIMRGINDSEIPAFAELARKMPAEVRFIELMPLGHSRDLWQELHIPASEIRSMLGDLSSLPHEPGSSARLYSLPGGGTVGIISPISEAFCSECGRIRVTCTGIIKPCLRLPVEEDLRPLLNEPDLTERLGRMLVGLARHKLTAASKDDTVETDAMCMVGG